MSEPNPVEIAKEWIRRCSDFRLDPARSAHDHKGQFASGTAACGGCICMAMHEYAAGSERKTEETLRSVGPLVNAVKVLLDDWDRYASNAEIRADIDALRSLVMK